MWRFVLESIDLLSKPFRTEYQEFDTKLTGKMTEEPRWERCIKAVKFSSLGLGLSNLYIKKHFDDESRKQVATIVNLVKEQFKSELRKSDHWMDEETRKEALLKADAMLDIIAYPDEMLNDTLIDDYLRKARLNSID